MSLSEELSRLSVRAKDAENRVAAAKTEAREKLEQARSNARSDAQQTAEQLQAKSSAAAHKVKSYGEGLGQSWKEQLADVRPTHHREHGRAGLAHARQRHTQGVVGVEIAPPGPGDRQAEERPQRLLTPCIGEAGLQFGAAHHAVKTRRPDHRPGLHPPRETL